MNESLYHSVLLYKTTMALVKNMLRKELISAEEYAEIETKKYEFTGKIECGICGKNYRRKVTATGIVWICSTFNNMGKKECASKQIPDETIRTVIAKVLGIEKFNTEVFEEKIDKIIVPQANRLLFLFNDGHTVEQEWKDRSRSESWSKAMREKARQKALERKTDNGKNSNGYTGND